MLAPLRQSSSDRFEALPGTGRTSICKYTEICNPNVQKPEGSPPGKDGDIHPSVTESKAIGKLVSTALRGP
jgi:hypothetical protein